MVDYAREDLELRKRLCEVKYLCDDSSTGRGLHNVVSENGKLKEENFRSQATIEALQKQIDSLRNQVHGKNGKGKSHPKIIVNGGGTGGDASMRGLQTIPKLNLNDLKKQSHEDWYEQSVKLEDTLLNIKIQYDICLLYTSPSPRD